MGLGVVVPLVLLTFFRDKLLFIGIASAFYLVGFTMVPVNIIIPGLAYPMPAMEGVMEAFSHPKLSFQYTPALMEWLVVIFAVGVSLLVFTVGYRFIVEPYLREHH